MSLSQKHSGKILVPWYNNNEWISVCDDLFKKERATLQRALVILKIWKTRTPILPAGVEGTLIVLNALLSSESRCSKDETTQIYALSLLRFLNISAANNEKQGTFNKVAQKNDLPKWLIDIRHDIAHSNKLPSNSITELALWQSFYWLLEKYWKVQHNVLKDCNLEEDSTKKHVKSVLNIYIQVKINNYCQKGVKELDKSLLKNIRYVVNNKSKTVCLDEITEILEKTIKKYFLKSSKSMLVEIIPDTLISKTALLFCIGKDIMPKAFIQLWSNLLNIIYESELLFSLLLKLFQITITDGVCDNKEKTVAAHWIKTIFQELLYLKEYQQNLQENESYLKFENSEFLKSIDSNTLEDIFIRSPNGYTLIYLESVLKFHNRSEQYIKDVLCLVNCVTVQTLCSNNKIYTVSEIEEPVKNILRENTCVDDEMMDFACEEFYENEEEWTEIREKSMFAECPFGVLPHQVRDKNPTLLIL